LSRRRAGALDSGSTPLVFFAVAFPVSGVEFVSVLAAGAGAGAGSEPPQPEIKMAKQDADMNDIAVFFMIDFENPDN